MNKALRVALVYASKKMAKEISLSNRPGQLPADDDEPPDLLAEYDTPETITAVADALAQRYDVAMLDGDLDLFERLRRMRPDLVFNISEGVVGPNRESQVPIICEILGIPYTGSDALTLGICLDKVRAKEIMVLHKIPTAPFFHIEPDMLNGQRFHLPSLVKPVREGSSMGIRDNSLVTTRKELVERVLEIHRWYRQAALVEKFLPGREFTVGVLGNAPDYEVLPPIEIDHSVLPQGANPIYGYEAKWVWDDPANPMPILVCPARITVELENEIRELVRRVVTVLRVRDWCRVDLRLDAAGKPNVIELNPLPGILPDPRDNSALPAAARAAGYSYAELILKVAQTAARRHGLSA